MGEMACRRYGGCRMSTARHDDGDIANADLGDVILVGCRALGTERLLDPASHAEVLRTRETVADDGGPQRNDGSPRTTCCIDLGEMTMRPLMLARQYVVVVG